MNMTPIGAVPSSTTQASAVAQPTAQQAARFEQQLELPTSEYYQPQLVQPSWPAGNWPAVMQDIGRVAEQFRADTEALKTDPVSMTASAGHPAGDAQRSAEESFEKGMSQLTHLSCTMLNIDLITSTERMAGENVRTLYQLG